MSTRLELRERQSCEPNRRRFIASAAALSGAELLGVPRWASAEPPPETTTLRIMGSGAIVSCIAPVYVAQKLLEAEGFTEVRYVEYPEDTSNWAPEVLLAGEADISLSFPPTDLLHIDAGSPVVILAGSHIGCVELVAGSRVPTTRELKGKNVAIQRLGWDEHLFISMFAAYVGIDPRRDINWVVARPADYVRLLSEGQVDALMSGPTFSQDLRAKKIGHVIANTTTDRPWSQYFCCLVASTHDFVHKHPVATKRALRAILKAADICAREPKSVAQLIADKGMARYDYTLQMLHEIPYGKWREYDPEDSLRFYALRMRELGMIKSTPQRIIAQGTNWRFLNELKRELKG